MTKHCKSCRKDLEESKYSTGYKTCNDCRTKQKGRYKITLQDCQDSAILKGGLCLSTEYVNTKTKMDWKCSENHEWTTAYGCIRADKWCPKCARTTKLTLKDCQDSAIKKGGECLSTEYVDIKTKMD